MLAAADPGDELRFARAQGDRRADPGARASDGGTKGVGSIRERLEGGDPVRAILAFAEEENADLIAMGHRGLGDLEALFLGSVSNKVSHLATRSTMLVR